MNCCQVITTETAPNQNLQNQCSTNLPPLRGLGGVVTTDQQQDFLYLVNELQEKSHQHEDLTEIFVCV